MNARDFLYKHIYTDDDNYFGNKDIKFLNSVVEAWMNDESNSKHRYDTMKSIISNENEFLKKAKILDMSSGCGTFVFYGLLNGYNVYGVEPEKWKHEFNILKMKEKAYPPAWINRFCRGVGEHLSYKDETFDIISTYQVLEHVQSHSQCFSEFRRVLKKGGWLFIQCPDYLSFFEGHYRIPMLPLMKKKLFKVYLNILGKPTKGLDTINYITQKKIISFLDDDFKIIDLTSMEIRSGIINKTKVKSNIILNLLTSIYLIYRQSRNAFRSENSINLAAQKNG
jgi:2-polyprenyl-3-methyl-5-hydroxy-6-metoxy-1,4-benzoquinol methylase